MRHIGVRISYRLDRRAPGSSHNLLGTRPDQKKHVIYDGGHGIQATHRNQVIAEVLGWLDRFLGPVN